MAMNTPYPIGFIGHGAPTLALEGQGDTVDGWRAWGRALVEKHGTPKGIVVLSAHWLDRVTHFGPARPVGLIYDFYGFPEELYRVSYAPPTSPELVRKTEGLLKASGLPAIESPTRGLDHGAWVPLLHLFPKADIPVLQVSLKSRVPMADHVALGKALAPLRAKGYFILGSGNLTHNLRTLDFSDRAKEPVDWAKDFDDWTAERLSTGDLEGLARWQQDAPEPHRSHPTDDHFIPLVAAFSAAQASGAKVVRFPHEGFEFGTFSMRCVEFS